MCLDGTNLLSHLFSTTVVCLVATCALLNVVLQTPCGSDAGACTADLGYGSWQTAAGWSMRRLQNFGCAQDRAHMVLLP